MTITTRESSVWTANRNRGGRYVKHHTAQLGVVEAQAKTAAEAKRLLLDLLGGIFGSPDFTPRIIVHGTNVAVIYRVVPTYLNEETGVRWTYRIERDTAGAKLCKRTAASSGYATIVEAEMRARMQLAQDAFSIDTPAAGVPAIEGMDPTARGDKWGSEVNALESLRRDYEQWVLFQLRYDALESSSLGANEVHDLASYGPRSHSIGWPADAKPEPTWTYPTEEA